MNIPFMKQYIRLIVLILVTAGWSYLTCSHFFGMNSIQRVASYKSGIFSLTTLPQSGTRTIYTQNCNSRIYLDTLGIPHIFSKDLNSLGYSVGYMHARDRYFQMEVLTHLVMGRLSEIIGSNGVASDRFWKSLEIEETAKSVMDSLKKNQPDLANYLECYSKGVNDYIDQEKSRMRDPLYLFWDYTPQHWKPYYCLLIQWYMSYNLTFYDDYFAKQELLDRIPENIRHILYPDYPNEQIEIIPHSTRPEKNSESQESVIKSFKKGSYSVYQPHPFNRSFGSNNWVVDSSRTTTGNLFLCNDLHLFLTSPNIFYEIQLSCPSMHVYGFTIPGVPVVLTGHNERIAWGITNGGWDVTEQYLLKLNPKNKDQYWLDGKWRQMSIKKFSIAVKGQQSENFETRYTVFGQVVFRDSMAYALSWLPSQPTFAIRSFWNLAKAGNWEAFKESLRCYDYPSQNFAYADVMGNIGMICAGKMPIKPEHYGGGLLDGTVYRNVTYVPFDSLPSCYKPEQGYLYSANQEPEKGNYYYSSRWFQDCYRPRRIRNMISTETKKIDFDGMRDMQLDVLDLSTQDVRTLIKKYPSVKPLPDSWKIFLNWNGRLEADTKESVFFKAFRQAAEYYRLDIAKRLGVQMAPSYDQLMSFLLSSDSVSFQHNNLNGKMYFERLIRATDSIFNVYMSTHPGNKDSISDKSVFSFTVPELTFLPWFASDVQDAGGSDNTIDVNYSSAHPVIRTVIEIKNHHIESWMINALGQTGRVNEANYFQQLSSWKDNDLHKSQLAKDPEELNAVSRIVIMKKK